MQIALSTVKSLLPASTSPVAQPPVIAAAPQSLTVAAGARAAFSVQATGSPTPTFQWFRGTAAVQGATAQGQRFAKEDVERAKKDLGSIRDILVDTAKYFADRVSTETGSAFKSAKTHAEQTMAAAKPVVASSLEALAKHPIQTAGEAASTALRGSQLTAGALLSAVSGALAGAAELLDPDRRKKPETDASAEAKS